MVRSLEGILDNMMGTFSFPGEVQDKGEWSSKVPNENGIDIFETEMTASMYMEVRNECVASQILKSAHHTMKLKSLKS